MDRRIKAILVANDVEIEKIKIVGFKDDALEIIEYGKSVFITLDGRLNENSPVDIISQDDKIQTIIDTNAPFIISEIIEEVDDNLFDEEPIKKGDDVKIDLDEHFDFDDELEKMKKKETLSNDKVKPKKSTLKNKKNDDDNFIDIF